MHSEQSNDQNSTSNNNQNSSSNNNNNHQQQASSSSYSQHQQQQAYNYTFNQNELRETVLTRAAARFGRLYLRDPQTLVNKNLLRKLITTIRTTASLGHRSSVVLWGPPQGGKRSTLEALAQIFCVSVENKAAANISSSSALDGAASNGVSISVHRHPQNSSSTVGAGSLGHGHSSGNNSHSSSSENKNSSYLQTNKGIPILGVVLDGTALRSDHDASQQCLNALYDFWWLAAMVRSREMKKWQSINAGNTTMMNGRGGANNSNAVFVTTNAGRKSGNNTATTKRPLTRAGKQGAAPKSPAHVTVTPKPGRGRPKKKVQKDSSSDDDDDEDDSTLSSDDDDDSSAAMARRIEESSTIKKAKSSAQKARLRRQKRAEMMYSINKSKIGTTTTKGKKGTAKNKKGAAAAAGKKKSTTVVMSPANKRKKANATTATANTTTSTNNQNNNSSNPQVVSGSNFLIQGAPFWSVHADELLNWLFTEALPETMHKQAPPASAAATATNSNNNSENNTSSSNTNNSIAHNLTAFRSAIQQTFRVFTHGGSTVLTALQTTLLELSKGGISPCFFIHDIRLLGQNCDKILYMISGLLHEQEVLSATQQAQKQSDSNNNNNGSNNNYNSDDAFSSSATSMMNAGLNLLNGATTGGNTFSSSSRVLPAALCGGGLSIIMSSPNPDLRLEKRLSSRMNCDYYFCPQIVPNFLQCLYASFAPLQENLETNEALHFSQQWAVEDATTRRMVTSETGGGIGGAIASIIVPGQQEEQTRNNTIQNQNQMNNNSNTNAAAAAGDYGRSSGHMSFSSLLNIQSQLSRRRLRAAEDPRLRFIEEVKQMEDDIINILAHEEIGNMISNTNTGTSGENNNSSAASSSQHQQQQQQPQLIPCRILHPLRAIYLDFSDKCEQLSRPAHVIRRLIENWFEIAIESCTLVNPASGKTVDIFNDPKSFITADMLERACFGYDTSVLSNSSSSSTSSSSAQNFLSSSSSSSSSSNNNIGTNTSFFTMAMNTVYFPSCTGSSPLVPLETFVLSGSSPSMPRECVSLLACLISAANQQKRGTPNAQIRTLQEHFVLFQELKGSNSSMTLGSSSAGSNNNNLMMNSSSSSYFSSSTSGVGASNSSFGFSGLMSSSSSTTIGGDTIDSWVKASALLRRWGIIRAWNSGGGMNNSNNTSSAAAASSGVGNIASSITTTSKLDLEIENIEALQALVMKSLSVVYDSQLASSVKHLVK